MPRFPYAAGPRPPRPGRPALSERLEPRRLLATFVVTTTADDGPGSLRQAIVDANVAPFQDRITFSIGDDPAAVHRIRPLSPLPEVTDSTWIMGYEPEPVRAPAPRIELDGSAAGTDADGLVLRGRQSAVMGLAIFGFSRHGVVASGGDAISVGANYIGLNAAGLPERGNGNGGAGVLVSSPFARVGSTGVFEQSLGNVISANAGPGVWVTGVTVPGGPPPSSTILVWGNRIGTSPDGTGGIGNGAEGVRVDNAYRPSIVGNTISDNGASGVLLDGTVDQPQLGGNRIGTDPAGALALGNGRDPASPNRDGIITAARDLLAADNVISANAGAGVNVVGGRAEIRGNRIGTDAAGARPLGTQAIGVRVRAGAGDRVSANVVGGNVGPGVLVQGSAEGGETFVSDNQIGARDDGTRIPNGDGVVLHTGATLSNNLISGNAGSGVRVAGATRGTIVGNAIGTDRAATVAVPNGRDGVEVAGGFLTDVTDNVISGNALHGVSAAAETRDTYVAGNFVGTDRAATRALGNGGSGVYAAGAVYMYVGAGGFERPGNVIAHNAGDGITVTHQGSSPAVAVRVSGNSIFSNGRLGIDLAADGVTPNDPGDADTGPNSRQNFPLITRVQATALDVRVTLRLESLPGRVYRMELFASPAPDASGHGEGKRLLGAVVGITSDAAGVATHTLSFRTPAFPLGEWLTATASATESGGDTSEFSPAVRSRPLYRPRGVWAPPTREVAAPAAASSTPRAAILQRPPARPSAIAVDAQRLLLPA